MIASEHIIDFNVTNVRKDFPILSEIVYGKKLVYFDNGATSQKPTQVIKAIENYYYCQNANVHRGAHYLSQLATDAFEAARKKTADFIQTNDETQVIFFFFLSE